MSGRVSKTRVVSTPSSSDRRKHLLASFDDLSFEAMPCSRCFSKKLKCEMVEGVRSCKCCTRVGRSCDGSGVPAASLERVLDEHRRLQREESAAEDAFLELQRRQQELFLRMRREMDEAIGRLIRLRKMRASARERGVKMVQREFQSIEELEAAEEEEARAANAAQAAGAVIDWSSVGSELPVLDGFFLGGTSVPSFDNEPSVT